MKFAESLSLFRLTKVQASVRKIVKRSVLVVNPFLDYSMTIDGKHPVNGLGFTMVVMGIVLVIVTIVVAVVSLGSKKSCVDRAEAYGYSGEWGLFTGCIVTGEDGKPTNIVKI